MSNAGRKGRTLIEIYPADLTNAEWALLEPIKGQFPRMQKVWADQGYNGKGRE